MALLLNNIDEIGQIKFTMQVAGHEGLVYLDLKVTTVGDKISVDLFSKPTNSFTYVLTSTCYPNRNT